MNLKELMNGLCLQLPKDEYLSCLEVFAEKIWQLHDQKIYIGKKIDPISLSELKQLITNEICNKENEYEFLKNFFSEKLNDRIDAILQKINDVTEIHNQFKLGSLKLFIQFEDDNIKIILERKIENAIEIKNANFFNAIFHIPKVKEHYYPEFKIIKSTNLGTKKVDYKIIMKYREFLFFYNKYEYLLFLIPIIGQLALIFYIISFFKQKIKLNYENHSNEMIMFEIKRLTFKNLTKISHYFYCSNRRNKLVKKTNYFSIDQTNQEVSKL